MLRLRPLDLRREEGFASLGRVAAMAMAGWIMGVVVATGMVAVVGAGASTFLGAVVGGRATLTMVVVGTGFGGVGRRAVAGFTAAVRGLGFCAAGEFEEENNVSADRPATVAAKQR